jgi:hypothetical protein
VTPAPSAAGSYGTNDASLINSFVNGTALTNVLPAGS